MLEAESECAEPRGMLGAESDTWRRERRLVRRREADIKKRCLTLEVMLDSKSEYLKRKLLQIPDCSLFQTILSRSTVRECEKEDDACKKQRCLEMREMSKERSDGVM